MLTKNYVYLNDHEGSHKSSLPMYKGTSLHPLRLEGVSAVLYYVNALGLAHFFSDLEQALRQHSEERARAVKEAEQATRKGL